MIFPQNRKISYSFKRAFARFFCASTVKVAMLSLIPFLFTSCVTAPLHRHVYYSDIPDDASVKILDKSFHPGGKLVVEEFRDYRYMEGEVPKQSSAEAAFLRLLIWPWSGVSLQIEKIGLGYKRDQPLVGELFNISLAKAASEDFQRRAWFDEVVYKAALDDKVEDADWRFVGRIAQTDGEIRYRGYYLPVIPIYFYFFGAPYAKVNFDVALELKFENLKTGETIIKKEYSRRWLSRYYNEYQFNMFGHRGWVVSYYELARAYGSLMNEFTDDLRRALEKKTV